MDSSLSESLDSICCQIKDFLNNYEKSVKIQEFFSEMLISFFYANLIHNFFSNLTQNNIKEYSLPYGKIGDINKFFTVIKLKCKRCLSEFKQNNNISLEDYDIFKNEIKKHYREFYLIIQYIEDEIDYPEQAKKLNDHINAIKTTGIKPEEASIGLSMETILLEHQLESSSLRVSALGKPAKELIINILEGASSKIIKHLDDDLNEMFDHEQKRKEHFGNVIFDIWSTPIILMQGLIKLCSETVEIYVNELANNKHKVELFKLEALLKLFSRAIQTANEILILAQNGYADGAFARWRSLHEITVTALFLEDNEAYVSDRFLNYIHVSIYNDALSYKNKYRKLGYAPLGRKTFNLLKRNYDAVKQQYGDDFTRKYGWIPLELSIARNFSALEKHVNLDKFRPYYRKASHVIHAGPNSFFSLGQYEDQQYLITDPSPYGLVEPLDNCAISLLNITLCILNHYPTFDSAIKMKIISKWSLRVSDALTNVNPDDYYCESKE